MAMVGRGILRPRQPFFSELRLRTTVLRNTSRRSMKVTGWHILSTERTPVAVFSSHPLLQALFTQVRGIGILGSSPPALCVAPSLCGRDSYVEIKGSCPCLHKALSGAGR